MAVRRSYGVFNHTDGVWAWPFPMSREEADEFVDDFPGRYVEQGFYRTASGKRIDPEEVELEVVRIDED